MSLQSSTRLGCCGWLRGELSCKTPLFGLTDPNGKTLDLERSFGMSNDGRFVRLLLKFCFWAWCVKALVKQWVISTHPHWFIAYLTQWTLLLTCIYMACSLYLSTITNTDNKKTLQGLKNYQWQLVKITWGLFSIVSCAGGGVVLMYWLAIYDYTSGAPEYYSVMSHGVAFLLVLIDGFVLNKIPLRLKHYLFTVSYGLLFVGWSLIAAYANIDNPDTSSEDNTEALYSILDWINSPVSATISSVGVNFVVLPLYAIIFWGVSISCCRKYKEDQETEEAGASASVSGAIVAGDKLTDDNGSDTHVGDNEDDIEEGGIIEAKPY